MSKSSEKNPTSGTFSMADPVTHIVLGEGLLSSCGERTLPNIHPETLLLLICLGPWSPARLTLLLQPPCLLWFLSPALTFCSLGDLPYYPYLTFVPPFLSVLCILLTLVLPIVSGKEQGSFLPQRYTLSLEAAGGSLHFPLGREKCE